MPTDSELFPDAETAAIAHMLAEDRADELTDMLVEGLYEALRILEGEITADTWH
ncbi:hypothetical protein [Rhizobium halophytocola]|uniref:IS256 family transposase n=1 Tax=Rhizobium halophytocola TaxID=735519 RepID=A0ABS4E198_9HYPH|nr:hypothetical protein [Rhizobium halophytocola]MBP1851723.1 hypothetical protein [Rhizobium halophytocola]